jgi:hypothetical protein
MSVHSAAGRRLEIVCWDDKRTYMHHFGLTLSIASVEEVQHILLKLLTVPVDIFSCLPRL